jgi:hypothetical protein
MKIFEKESPSIMATLIYDGSNRRGKRDMIGMLPEVSMSKFSFHPIKLGRHMSGFACCMTC